MSNKFLDKTGLTHFWGKIKTLLAGKADKEELNEINELVNDFNTDISELYNTKADEDHIHPNSVKIETPNGKVAKIFAIDEEGGSYYLEAGSFHSTGSISSEGDISAEGRIISRSFDFDMAGDRCISVNHSNEAIEVFTDGYALTVDSGTLFLDGDVNANIARVDEVDFKMCDNDGNEAPEVLMYGYYDENDERHLIVENINQLDVTGSIKAERQITISASNGDNVYLFAQPGGEEDGEKFPPSIETGNFHSTGNISSEGKVIAEGEIYEEGTPLSDKYASKTDLEDVRDALVTCDATVGGLVDSVSDLEDNTEKMTNHYIGHPEGGDAWFTSNTGAICIRIPVLTGGGHIKFKVSITTQRYQASADYFISCTLASNYLANTTAYCITSIQNGDASKGSPISLHSLPVSFSYKTDGYYYIYIGDVNKEWANIAVSVSDVTFNSDAYAEKEILRKDWAITLETSINQSIIHTITNTALYTPKQKYTLDEIGTPNSVVGSIPYASGAYISSIRAMRLFGLPADQIIIEQSIDGGQTWIDAGQSDTSKMALFNQSRTHPIYMPQKNGKKSCDCMTRITITGMKYNVPSGTVETEKYNYWNTSYVQPSGERYCTLDFGYFWVNANADRLYIEHQMATGANPNNWISDGILQKAQGWAGGNYIKFDERTFGATASSQSSNYWNHRFIFRTQATDGSFDDSKLNQSYITDKQYLYEISCYGANCWVAPNEMMKSDRAYSISTDGIVRFQNTVASPAGFYFINQSNPDKKLLRADGWWQHVDTFATADHNHTNSDLEVNTLYSTGTISTDGVIFTEGGIQSENDIIVNGVNLMQEIDEIKTDLSTMSTKPTQFKIMTRKTATTNEAVDISSYINNSKYSELMIIVRTQATAAVTLGISNTTSATTSNFIASKSLSNGTSYTKIILNKTDEGYYMWDVNGSIGFSNDATYKYIRNYSSTANAVSSMSIAIHGR